MKYQGGKSRVAKPIAEIISAASEDSDCFVSLFCGACSVEARVEGYDRVICNDNQPYLIEMLRALQNGWIPPDNVSEEEYKYIRDHKDENKPLTAFVGFGCSFGGRWFNGYARSKKVQNYSLQSKNSLIKKIFALQKADFVCKDYREVELPSGCVVYADPPYGGNVTKLSPREFDTDAFWDYMREISKEHKVFISELEAPDDFVAVWDQDVWRSIEATKQFKATERLFVHIQCAEG